jgi:hypothetical protein
VIGYEAQNQVMYYGMHWICSNGKLSKDDLGCS